MGPPAQAYHGMLPRTQKKNGRRGDRCVKSLYHGLQGVMERKILRGLGVLNVPPALWKGRVSSLSTAEPMAP